jgi:hypothetical protein
MVLTVKKSIVRWKQGAGMRILFIKIAALQGPDRSPTGEATEAAIAAEGYEIQSLAVQLVDCNAPQTANLASALAPQAILVEAIGDMIEHPCLINLTQIMRRIMSKTRIVWLSDAPVSQWREVLTNQPQIDYILRWGDIDSLLGLIENLDSGQPTPQRSGIAYWSGGQPVLF